jgi:8-hydroxy-5-deazaflavin:NADPH oxidoreductase
MKIGILGSGDVARALGAGFAKHGHDIKLGTREPAKLADWTKQHGARASAGTFAETVAFGELIVLATLWTGTKSAIDLAGGAARFAGKTVIDATNPLDLSTGAPRLALGHTDSGGEQVQRWLEGAHVVKAFNTVGNAHMVNPDFPGGPPDMFIAGNDDGAKRTVTGVLTQFGWNTIDVGGIDGARLLEPLCILWVTYGVRHKSWNHAFKLLRK